LISRAQPQIALFAINPNLRARDLKPVGARRSFKKISEVNPKLLLVRLTSGLGAIVGMKQGKVCDALDSMASQYCDSNRRGAEDHKQNQREVTSHQRRNTAALAHCGSKDADCMAVALPTTTQRVTSSPAAQLSQLIFAAGRAFPHAAA
jgi:hypothetical protein